MWLPPDAGPAERLTRAAVVAVAILVLLFLTVPILIVVPLSFSSEPFFSLPLPGLSLRWYADFFGNARWLAAVLNSTVVAVAATVLATALGTLAALGLGHPAFPWRSAAMAVLVAPLIVPVVILAVGTYLLFGRLGLVDTRPGLVLAHTVLALPLVVVTVTAALKNHDRNLVRAAAGLGAPPLAVFFRVTLPLIAPGVVAGALFAFATSFDEVVVALFLTGAAQRTLPVQMFAGIRDQINPTIMSAATCVLVLSVALFAVVTWLTGRSRRS